MSNENPWKNDKSSNKNKSLFSLIAFVIILLVAASASNSNTKTNSPESNYAEPTANSVDECKSLIKSKTLYDIDRLSYIGSNEGNPVVTYYVDSDLTHKFQCINGGVQLWAKGAGTWIPM